MKYTISLCLIAGVLVFSYCNTPKKLEAPKAVVTYEKDIQPIFAANCAPCHFPEQKGKKSPLDNYDGIAGQIDDIIRRIELQPGDKGYMPMKKPRLSDSAIMVIKTWKAEGLAK